MHCTAPPGYQVPECIGPLRTPVGEAYQCPFCAHTCKLHQRAGELAERLRSHREEIGNLLIASDPHSVARRGTWKSPPKVQNGWIKYLKNPNTADLIGTLAQKQWSKMVEVVLVELFSNVLEGAQTHFALCISGSIARREACPYSDIESFFLIDNETYADFFKKAAYEVQTILKLSGEQVRGLDFDEELCPYKHVYTPWGMVEFLEKIINDFRSDPGRAAAKRGVLTDIRFIFGDEGVFNEFVGLLKDKRENLINKNHSDVLNAWKRELSKIFLNGQIGGIYSNLSDQSPYVKFPSGRLDLKKQYYRWLEQIPRFLCEYYKLSSTKTKNGQTITQPPIGARKQVEELCKENRISYAIRTKVLWALETLARLRVEAQLAAEYQIHTVLKSPPEGIPSSLQKRAKFEQDANTGEWTPVHVGDDPLPVLNDSEKADLGEVHKIVDLLIRKSQEFFNWAEKYDMENPVEVDPKSVKGVFLKLRPKEKKPPPPSPFMDEKPAFITGSIF